MNSLTDIRRYYFMITVDVVFCLCMIMQISLFAAERFIPDSLIWLFTTLSININSICCGFFSPDSNAACIYIQGPGIYRPDGGDTCNYSSIHCMRPVL